MRRRTAGVAIAAAVVAGVAAPSLRARERAVLRILVAYPPGGVSDATARLFARLLEPALGETVIVENRAGAGGAVALGAVARASAQGRVLGFSAISPLSLSPHLGTPAPQVQPLAAVMRTPMLLLGTPALGVAGFDAMAAQARARPGQLRWATSGTGTLGHLVLEEVRRALRLDVIHVPYSGGGPQLQDALAGRFELLSSNLAPLQLDYVAQGRLQALALGAPRRSGLLPAVPTFAELGCPAANRSSLFGLFAPPTTPAARSAALHAACMQVLKAPAFVQALQAAGNDAAPGTPQDFAAEIARESAANRRLLGTR